MTSVVRTRPRSHLARALGLSGLAAVVYLAISPRVDEETPAGRGQGPDEGPTALPPEAPPPTGPEAGPPSTETRTLMAPTGAAPEVDCDGARRIVAQARKGLSSSAEEVDRAKFAAAVSDWIDPHGLWSVAPDSPVGAALRRYDLTRDLEASPGGGACEAAAAVGAELGSWVRVLRRELEAGRDAARRAAPDHRRRFELASTTPFEDGPVTRRAQTLARSLGHRLGALEAAYGERLATLADVSAARLAPEHDDARWARVVLAAAVRAYVPQIDPHGAWAPLDEEASIYDLDLEIDPPPRLWLDMTRTPVGVRLDRGARAPLHDGDVVLSVDAVAVGGMSVEQANQLSFFAAGTSAKVLALRSGAPEPISLDVEAGPELLTPPPSDTAATGLGSIRVPYGAGHALVVRVPDVPDDLGDRLLATLGAVEDHPVGILLDLRGNGGGSTDGALGAIGVFLPGAALFPMRRRDGAIDVDTAPRPAEGEIWHGPVAALVDGESASAAEMIAGAIAAYDRGVVLGSRTYGKGCAQEYLEDDAGVGVLRLTTLVFSLPDGTPLQRVGVSPHVALGLPAAPEREDALPRAPKPWAGPDVRTRELVRDVPWPESGGRVGNAADPVVRRALRALGTTRVAARGLPGGRTGGD